MCDVTSVIYARACVASYCSYMCKRAFACVCVSVIGVVSPSYTCTVHLHVLYSTYTCTVHVHACTYTCTSMSMLPLIRYLSMGNRAGPTISAIRKAVLFKQLASCSVEQRHSCSKSWPAALLNSVTAVQKAAQLLQSIGWYRT